jgi:phosphohistidine phosphatase
MKVYIFRHGEALSKGDRAVSSDADRPLVEEGIRRSRQAVEGFSKLGITIEAIFTSPWLRAKQTAAIAADVLGLTDHLFEMEELAGDHSIEDVMNALTKHSSSKDIMLVGHNPQLSDLAAYLLSLSTGMQIDLKKSGMCAVEVERIPPKKPGTLLWMMSPKQLRSLR